MKALSLVPGTEEVLDKHLLSGRMKKRNKLMDSVMIQHTNCCLGRVESLIPAYPALV